MPETEPHDKELMPPPMPETEKHDKEATPHPLEPQPHDKEAPPPPETQQPQTPRTIRESLIIIHNLLFVGVF
jgi:hypothetical protein